MGGPALKNCKHGEQRIGNLIGKIGIIGICMILDMYGTKPWDFWRDGLCKFTDATKSIIYLFEIDKKSNICICLIRMWAPSHSIVHIISRFI